MKCFTVFLAGVAAVLISQTEASPLDALHNLDDTVSATVDFLQAFKIAFEVDADQKFASYLEAQRNVISDIVSNVRKEVQEKGDESGKNVTHCNQQIQLELNATLDKVLTKLNRCFAEETPDWSVHDDDFNNQITKGEELHQKNEEIEKNCKSDKVWVTNLCISKKLPQVRLATRLYKREVGAFKETLFRSFYTGIYAVEQCFNKPLSKFGDEVRSAKESAFDCIEKA